MLYSEPYTMSKFTTADIEKLFAGMTPTTKQILSVDLKETLIPTIRGLLAAGPITPASDLIFNAFKFCPIENTSVVIIGQDPYHDGSAMGLSFGGTRKGLDGRNGKIPPSLRNIYSALVKSGLVQGMPRHPDLSRWASQGVLMLNTALTTAPKVAGVHTAIWIEYIRGVLGVLGRRTSPTAFVLWGAHAKSAMDGIVLGPQHKVFEWGHPSPMSTVNRQIDNPESFINCDSFTKVNEFRVAAGLPPVDWNVDEGQNAVVVGNEPAMLNIPTDPILGSPLVLAPPPTLWVFTDGGAKANGRRHCSAAWAWYATDGKAAWVSRGKVAPAVIGGKTIPPSNNRGELTALLSALAWASGNHIRYSQIMVISDSDYSIKAITTWFPGWKAKGALADKKNIDLITAANLSYESIRAKTTINHTRSHQDEPEDKQSAEWFIWRGNDICDKLCEQ